MSGENRRCKRKNGFRRWLAMALTVALLAGQGHIPALAQEDVGDVPTIGISDETATDASDSGSTGESDGEETQEDGAAGDNRCACETACTAENVNGECSVCTANYDARVGNIQGGGSSGGCKRWTY